jgi:hypothetical protein
MKLTSTGRRTASALTALGGTAALAVSLVTGPGAALATASSTTSTTSTTSASGSTIAAPTPGATACDRAPWELKVQGRPHSFSGRDRGGVYLWHNTTGFHLRVTHRTNERVVYSGVITSSAAMRMDPVRLEKGDYVRISASHRVIAFAFGNHGHIDGINFHTDCAQRLTVSHLRAGLHRLPTDRVYLGVTKAHPAHIPFVVHRIV